MRLCVLISGLNDHGVEPEGSIQRSGRTIDAAVHSTQPTVVERHSSNSGSSGDCRKQRKIVTLLSVCGKAVCSELHPHNAVQLPTGVSAWFDELLLAVDKVEGFKPLPTVATPVSIAIFLFCRTYAGGAGRQYHRTN